MDLTSRARAHSEGSFHGSRGGVVGGSSDVVGTLRDEAGLGQSDLSVGSHGNVEHALSLDRIEATLDAQRDVGGRVGGVGEAISSSESNGETCRWGRHRSHCREVSSV